MWVNSADKLCITILFLWIPRGLIHKKCGQLKFEIPIVDNSLVVHNLSESYPHFSVDSPAMQILASIHLSTLSTVLITTMILLFLYNRHTPFQLTLSHHSTIRLTPLELFFKHIVK